MCACLRDFVANIQQRVKRAPTSAPKTCARALYRGRVRASHLTPQPKTAHLRNVLTYVVCHTLQRAPVAAADAQPTPRHYSPQTLPQPQRQP